MCSSQWNVSSLALLGSCCGVPDSLQMGDITNTGGVCSGEREEKQKGSVGETLVPG